jgi:polysaccharide export outer membrane protein
MANAMMASWKKMGMLQICLGAVLLAFCIGCETLDHGGNAAAPTAAKMPSPDILRTGDKIQVEYGDVPNTPPSQQTIRDDGSIDLLHHQTFMAAGKTRAELSREIEKRYVPEFFKRLTVTIRVEDRFYFVGGEVRSPARIVYVGDMTVTKAIRSAGDFTDFANKKKVELIRGNGHREVIDCEKAMRDSKKDLPIYPGDQIYVPRRLF